MLRKPGQVLGVEREQAEQIQAKKEAHSKVNNYGKYVREMYWPKVSQKNQNAMAKLHDKAMNENKPTRTAKKVKVDTSAWRGEFQKSQSQAHLPSSPIQSRSGMSQEAIPEFSSINGNPGIPRRNLKSNAMIQPKTDIKKQS